MAEVVTTPDKNINDLKEAVDNNATNAPHMVIDQEDNKMGIAGDPTEIDAPDGKYVLEFEYTADMLSESDKKDLLYDKDTDRYYLKVTYENKRVKPLYRSKVVLFLTKVFTETGILSQSGYTSDAINGMTMERILQKGEEIAEVAHLILGVDREQLDYMSEWSIIKFFSDIIRNEPNIIGECLNFLSRSTERNKIKKN